MSNIIQITINGQDHVLGIKEYRKQRVVALKDIDTLHGRVDGTARRNFNKNLSRFIEKEDYFVRNSSEAQNEFGITAPNGLTLLTESGYLMLVKSFTDDLAWQVQRQLVKSYFRSKATAIHPDTILTRKLNLSTKLSKGLTKEQQLNLRIIAVKQAQEESGIDYSEILAVLDPKQLISISPLQEFSINHCIAKKDASIGKTELYQIYTNWCFSQNVNVLSRNVFNRELMLIFPSIKEVRTLKIRKWIGISICDQAFM